MAEPALRADHPLIGCALKLTKANNDLHALDAEIRDFLESNPIGGVTEVEPQTGDIIFRAQIIRQPTQRWMIEVGAICYQLRSALDHLVYKLARLGPHQPGSRTAYPIFDKAGKFRHWEATFLKGVRSEHRAVIESTQPYHAGNEWLLWLDLLGNADKHNELVGLRLMPQQSAIETVVTKAPLSGDVALQITVPPPDGRLYDGAEVARASLPPQHRDMPVKVEIETAVVFGEGQWTLTDVSSILVNVERIIARFAPAFET